ncbi:MAG TPA: EamA family transporter [Phenylobacterium sp.]|nr:EamA family transporter [Phenylobacterium sp.]
MSDAAMTSADNGRGKALLVLLAGACVIGIGPVLVRLADSGPSASAFWRLVFALPLLALLARRNGDGVGAPSQASLLAGCAFALDLAFWHYGIAYTSVAKATVLSNLTPVVVTAVAWIFLRQKPRRLFLVAVALAVAGAWIMALTKGQGAPVKNAPLGDMLSTTTAIWYALYFLAVSSARKTQGATRIMFWSTLMGIPILLLAALGLHEQLLPASALGWAACVGLGLMHVAGQGSIAWALGRLPAEVASVVVLIQPIVASILGWLMFNELFGPWQAFGGAVALAGVVLAQWASRARPAAA